MKPLQKKPLHKKIQQVLDRVRERSAASRSAYLADIKAMHIAPDSDRRSVSCSNMAHVAAAAGQDQDELLSQSEALKPNIAIITAYNDMLSAHQPFENYPALIRAAAREAGATAQVAGGVPAMCDGVTQGRPGMELSLFSRDIIAMSTAVGLSHNVYDAALCLGVCDKIVPGLVMGALSFGHLPVIFVPAGPMESGLPNAEKAQIRKAFARGDKLVVARARKIQRFLSQPFFVAEVFTGSPGKLVDLESTIKGFDAICKGEYDHLPEAAFYMVGTIEEAIEKAKKMEKEAAA